MASPPTAVANTLDRNGRIMIAKPVPMPLPASSPSAIIITPSSVSSPSNCRVASPVARSFLQQWLETWQTFLPVTAFHDEIRSFLSGRSAAAGLFQLLQQDASGIFNLSGEASMSRYEFALLAREIFELTEGKVIPKSQQEIEMTAYRPPVLALDNQKIMDTGFQPSHPKYELKALKKEIFLPPGFSEN